MFTTAIIRKVPLICPQCAYVGLIHPWCVIPTLSCPWCDTSTDVSKPCFQLKTRMDTPPEVDSSNLPMPSLAQIAKCAENPASAVYFMMKYGILPNAHHCSCGKKMDRRERYNMWKCPTKTCRKKVSVYKDSFFGNARITSDKVLMIAYCFLQKVQLKEMAIMCKVSRQTCGQWAKFLREIIAWDLDPDYMEPIGGPGVIVELDESKFGKRKHHRGHRVEGVWVFGGVERTTERRCFAVTVENRTAVTLSALIAKYVKAGSIVYTDCWKGYRPCDFKRLRMTHHTVNHSQHFVDPATGVHTNTIEGTWHGIKYNVPQRHKSKEYTPGHLWEFMWRRQHEGQLWNRLLRACIARCRYDTDTKMVPKTTQISLNDVLPLNETVRFFVSDEAVDDDASIN